EFEQAQTLVISDCDHRSKWRIDSLHEHWLARLRSRRRITKNPRERFAKTALRFKSTSVSRFIHATALSHFAQGKAHSARAMVSLECHPVMALELPPCRRWIDRHRGKLLVS